MLRPIDSTTEDPALSLSPAKPPERLSFVLDASPLDESSHPSLTKLLPIERHTASKTLTALDLATRTDSTNRTIPLGLFLSHHGPLRRTSLDHPQSAALPRSK